MLKELTTKIFEAVRPSYGHEARTISLIVTAALVPERLPGFALDMVQQVAMYTPDMDKAKSDYARLGLATWVNDIVTGDTMVYDADGGMPISGISVAELSFNYDLGFELELIRYHSPHNWHEKSGRLLYRPLPFPSHMSWHVESIEEARKPIEAAGFKVAQSVLTLSHTNPYLVKNGRKFRYLVFNSRNLLGWDIKLIERIEAL